MSGKLAETQREHEWKSTRQEDNPFLQERQRYLNFLSRMICLYQERVYGNTITIIGDRLRFPLGGSQEGKE